MSDLSVSDLHLVDYAVLSFKTEEFHALLSRFDQELHIPVPAPRREYVFRRMKTANGREATVALVRTMTQGLGDAQNATTDIIEDLNPRLIVASGIAGGQPGTDVYLGDVVLATYIHDFSQQADTPDGVELATSGFDVLRQVGVVIATLPALRAELGGWHTENEVGFPRPSVSDEDILVVGGPDKWKAKVRQAVEYHKNRDHPIFVDGPIGSSDDLIKTAEAMRRRLEVNRKILAVEMEAAGVARACKRRVGETPLLVVRAISDIPELKRKQNYEMYACNVAASFTKALVRLDIIQRISPDASPPVAASNLTDLLSVGSILADPIPATVLQRSLQIDRDSLEDLLVKTPDSVRVMETDHDYITFCQDNGTPPTSDLVRSTLYEILIFIEAKSRERAGAKQCRNALALFLTLPMGDRRLLADRLFAVLDKPMKALGDKQLVIEAANACVEATTHESRSPREAECEARARICGLSWAYQRMGRLDLAADEAEKSLVLSQHLNLRTNLAFCMKCMGRLERMRAESEGDEATSRTRYQRSTTLLKDAIETFSRHEDFGPGHPEIGDCFSLLGRTYLAMGSIELVSRCVEQASELLIDKSSKDFLDLAILKAELAAVSGATADAFSRYREVLGGSRDEDYQRSEIVARALLSRARLYVRLGLASKAKLDFQGAAEIWETYRESEFAGQARWEDYRARQRFSKPIVRLLEGESSFAVRAEACRRYVEGAELGQKSVLSRRHRHDSNIMARCLKAAREAHALRRQQDLL